MQKIIYLTFFVLITHKLFSQKLIPYHGMSFSANVDPNRITQTKGISVFKKIGLGGGYTFNMNINKFLLIRSGFFMHHYRFYGTINIPNNQPVKYSISDLNTEVPLMLIGKFTDHKQSNFYGGIGMGFNGTPWDYETVNIETQNNAILNHFAAGDSNRNKLVALSLLMEISYEKLLQKGKYKWNIGFSQFLRNNWYLGYFSPSYQEEVKPTKSFVYIRFDYFFAKKKDKKIEIDLTE